MLLCPMPHSPLPGDSLLSAFDELRDHPQASICSTSPVIWTIPRTQAGRGASPHPYQGPCSWHSKCVRSNLHLFDRSVHEQGSFGIPLPRPQARQPRRHHLHLLLLRSQPIKGIQQFKVEKVIQIDREVNIPFSGTAEEIRRVRRRVQRDI